MRFSDRVAQWLVGLIQWLGDDEHRFFLYFVIAFLMTPRAAKLFGIPASPGLLVMVPIVAVFELLDLLWRKRMLLRMQFNNLNMRQRWCVWLTGVGILASLLFPPWSFKVGYTSEWRDRPRLPDSSGTGKPSDFGSVFGGRTEWLEHEERRWIFDLPTKPYGADSFSREIALPELGAQVSIIIVLGLGLLWVLQNGRADAVGTSGSGKSGVAK
jgi:hypothetical protein